MIDVADDGDLKSFEIAFVLANRRAVEKRLGRMFVRAVAGIDDRTLHMLGNESRCA